MKRLLALLIVLLLVESSEAARWRIKRPVQRPATTNC